MGARRRVRVIVQRPAADSAGDGAGNFETGWETLIGPIWAKVDATLFSGREDKAQGQTSSDQPVRISIGRNNVTSGIDNRHRIIEPVSGSDATPKRIYDIKGVIETFASEMTFMANLSPV